MKKKRNRKIVLFIQLSSDEQEKNPFWVNLN